MITPQFIFGKTDFWVLLKIRQIFSRSLSSFLVYRSINPNATTKSR